MRIRFLRLGYLVFFQWMCLSAAAQNTSLTISGPQVVCAGDCFTLTANWAGTTDPNVDEYVWSVTIPGSTNPILLSDSTKQIVYCTTVPGSYVFTLRVTNANGGIITTTLTVLAMNSAQPIIVSDNNAPCNATGFGGADQTGCERLCPFTTVTYSVVFPGGIPGLNSALIIWEVSGALSYTINPAPANTVTVNWGATGSGSVSVVTYGGQSTTMCSGEAALCVTVIESPKAEFTTTPSPQDTLPLRVCKGQEVFFENMSTGAGSYEWVFGDTQEQSNQANPVRQFDVPGFFPIRLVASSNCLCADTVTRWIEVIDAEAPQLNCIGTVCPGAVVTYMASNACPPYQWNVSSEGVTLAGGDATTDSITIQWTGGPAGVISLQAMPCSGAACPQPAQFRIPVISGKSGIRGRERVCPGAEEIYSVEPFGGAGFEWGLSGGGEIKSGQGTHQVTVAWSEFANPNIVRRLWVRYDNCYLGCGGRDTIEVRIVPSLGLNGPVERCPLSDAALNAFYINGVGQPAVHWSLEDPSGAIAWTSSAPSAAANIPLDVGAGLYRVLATPANPLLTCTDNARWNVYVAPQPDTPGGITGPNAVCTGETVSYAATGVGPGTSLEWTIQNGPGAPVNQFGPSVAVNWGAQNPRNLTLRARSNNGVGCYSAPVTLDVGGIETVVITGSSVVCLQSRTQFALQGGVAAPVQWQVSPASAGTVASGQGSSAISVYWREAGGHVLNAIVCGQTIQFPVSVIALPEPVVVHPATLCDGQIAIVNTATPYDSYVWRNAAGVQLGASANVVLGPGSYSVEVTDLFGCSGSTGFSIGPAPQPVISISTADPTSFCNNAVTVNMQALVPSDGVYTYEWFQNGIPLGVNSPFYATNQYGAYTVQATNADGCSATAGPLNLIPDCGGGGGGGGAPGGGGPPCLPGTLGMTINATARCDSFAFAITGPYVPGTAQWFFGKMGQGVEGMSTLDAPQFVFADAGIYVVALFAESSSGGVCRVLDSVRVVAKAKFDVMPGCLGADSRFRDRSVHLPGVGISAWAWDFGDPASGGGNTSVLQNPDHVYANSGDYVAELQITAITGCLSRAEDTLKIIQPLVPYFDPPAVTCSGNALEFVSLADSSAIEVNWNFGDPAFGSSNEAAGSPAYHAFSPGAYTVTLQAVYADGCFAEFSRNITVGDNTLTGSINPANPSPICEGQSVLLTADPSGVAYLWSDSLSTGSQTLAVTQAGLYGVTLTDGLGCTAVPPPVWVSVVPSPDAVIKAAITNSLGQIVAFEYPVLGVCEGEPVYLVVQGQGAYTYSWSTGQTGSEKIFSTERGNPLPVGTHIFTVTITDGVSGCTAVSEPFVVEVFPTPSGLAISLSNSPACAGTANTIAYSGPQPPEWQFVWNTGQAGVPLITERPGTYFLRAINQYGCEGRSNTLQILSGPPALSIPSGCHSRCRPDTLCLPPVPGLSAIQWYFNGAPISGATLPNLVATQSGAYYAVLTDTIGCTTQSDPLTLNLYDGFGTVAGLVWSDVDGDGTISPGDTVVPGVSVRLFEGGVLSGVATGGPGGGFAFANIPVSTYAVVIDTLSLPADWTVLIGEAPAALSGCGNLALTGLLIRFATCPTAFSQLVLSACDASFVTYEGVDIPIGSTQTFTFSSVNGCDSLVTVSAVGLQSTAGQVQVSACSGQTYTFNGISIPAGSSMQFFLQNAAGCDSVLTVIVSELPLNASAIQASACEGAAYMHYGVGVPAGTAQTFTYLNQFGCDSVVTVTVAALAHTAFSLDVSACDGSTYIFEGVSIPAGTTQIFTLTNAVGCDSIVTVNVAALPHSQETLFVQACAGETYDCNGIAIPAGNAQTFVLQNQWGCDSMLTVSVAALPVYASTLQLTACEGETIVFDGQTIPAGGSQIFSYQTASGCDSVIQVQVVALPLPVPTLLAVKVCPGDTYAYLGDQIAIGETRVYTLQGANQCDSVVTVSVSQASASFQTLDVRVCPGEVFVFDNTPVAPGETRQFVYQTSEGCDSVISVTVGAWPTITPAALSVRSCPNSPTGSLDASQSSGGTPPLSFALNGGVFQANPLFEGLPPGNYILSVEDLNGCVASVPAFVEARAPLKVSLEDQILGCETGEVVLRPQVSGDQSGLALSWSTGATGFQIKVIEAGTYWVEATNVCETRRAEAQVSWEAMGDRKFVYVPNVFKPKALLPANDVFRPLFANGVEVLSYRFEVYDRWGELLFRSARVGEGWPGPFREQSMQPGVFVWLLDAQVSYCGRIIPIRAYGDVTIVD